MRRINYKGLILGVKKSFLCDNTINTLNSLIKLKYNEVLFDQIVILIK